MRNFKPCGNPACTPCTFKDYEQKTFTRIAHFIRNANRTILEKGCFIDGGAHVGLYSVQVAAILRDHGIEPQIYAIDPTAATYRTLLENAKATGGVEVVRAALWNRSGTVYLQYGSVHAHNHVTGDTKPSTLQKAVPVPAIAIDDVAKPPNNRCWGMKLDLEGAEWQALLGARQMLLDNEQMIVVLEYNPEAVRRIGYTHRDVNAFMESHGFEPMTKADAAACAKPPAIGSVVNVHWTKGFACSD